MSIATTQWISQHLQETTLRAKSLIITVFGDSIAPHGGCTWLGSFIRLVAPLGLNERLVRTAVFRLSKEDWLKPIPIGRRSYYELTPSGYRRFEDAYQRIYQAPQQNRPGTWQIILIPERLIDTRTRDGIRKELRWDGFGDMAPGVMIRPSSINHRPFPENAQRAQRENLLLLLTTGEQPSQTGVAWEALARQCWALDELAVGYRRFIDAFSPLRRMITATEKPTPEQSFILRTLLIHDFRRVLLRDPLLPLHLLPEDWPGKEARDLCKEIYLKTQQQAEQHLLQILETTSGSISPAAPYYYERFGGLHETGKKFSQDGEA